MFFDSILADSIYSMLFKEAVWNLEVHSEGRHIPTMFYSLTSTPQDRDGPLWRALWRVDQRTVGTRVRRESLLLVEVTSVKTKLSSFSTLHRRETTFWPRLTRTRHQHTSSIFGGTLHSHNESGTQELFNFGTIDGDQLSLQSLYRLEPIWVKLMIMNTSLISFLLVNLLMPDYTHVRLG